MECKVKKENYIIIQGWMITELKLKGNELIIYSCIYGFTQAENQTFTGSLQYLADWTNSTKQGVIKSLKSLEAKGFIEKKENFINGVKFCEYKTTLLNKNEHPIKQSLMGGSKQSLTNNINNDNLDYNLNTAEQIIIYLNERAGTNFKPVDCNIKFITARLKDYTEDEIKAVIDKKVKEWKGTEMQQYIRPKTLFNATNFESYINGLATVKRETNPAKNFEHREYTKEELDSLFDNLDEVEI